MASYITSPPAFVTHSPEKPSGIQGWLLVGMGAGFGSGRDGDHIPVATPVRRQVGLSLSDQRVPRPLRWLIGVSLAIKTVPFPDFGVDEVVLIVVGLVLVIFYRPVLRAILDETRSVEADRDGPPLTAARKCEDPASQ